MSASDETPGTSASSYSTSSNSSSVENINSTVENGELSVFTFVVPGARVTPSSVPTDLGALLNQPSPDFGSALERRPETDISAFLYDPYRLDDPYAFHQKYHHGRGSPKSPPCCPYHPNPHINVLSDNNYIRLLPRTGDGLLLRSLEKGVLFPVIHWSSKYNENLSHHSQFGPSVAFNQGIYKEIKRVIPPDVWLQRDPLNTMTMLSSGSISASMNSVFVPSSSRKATWLVIGYKSLEKTLDSTLEASWKEWTGTRHVYLNLRSDFEIRKISFLHRVHPQDNLDLFMYLVVMEIGNVDEKNMIWLLDFVQRMRVERMKGFITAYAQVEQDISSVNDEYFKVRTEPKPRLKDTHVNTTIPDRVEPVKPVLSSGSRTMAAYLASSSFPTPLGDHDSEITGNIRFMEKILEEINQQPLGDYF